jgi:hypothetical protein
MHTQKGRLYNIISRSHNQSYVTLVKPKPGVCYSKKVKQAINDATQVTYDQNVIRKRTFH